MVSLRQDICKYSCIYLHFCLTGARAKLDINIASWSTTCSTCQWCSFVIVSWTNKTPVAPFSLIPSNHNRLTTPYFLFLFSWFRNFISIVRMLKYNIFSKRSTPLMHIFLYTWTNVNNLFIHSTTLCYAKIKKLVSHDNHLDVRTIIVCIRQRVHLHVVDAVRISHYV